MNTAEYFFGIDSALPPQEDCLFINHTGNDWQDKSVKRK
jgi:hypothetical protein